MNHPAVRTVSETDDVRVIEGLAYPFRGRDTYGTFFSARTDFHWGLFPDTDPAAVRADQAPAFIRPATFHHGFDKDYGLARVGGWSPVRMDADGVWVQAQIDKRQAYYSTRLGPLLDVGALGLSGGSAEHSVRIDQKSGEVLDWPAYELALTPVESNPLAQIATRSGETIRIIEARGEPAAQAVQPRPTAAMRAHSVADAQSGAYTLAALTGLMQSEADEPDQLAMLQRSADALTEWLTAERGEIGPADLEPDGTTEMDADSPAQQLANGASPFLSGVRIGRRNNATDAQSIQDIHNMAAQLGASCDPDIDTAGRSAEVPADAQPATVTIAVREDAPDFDELRRRAALSASEIGAQVARRLTG